jgi:hypothetical protein
MRSFRLYFICTVLVYLLLTACAPPTNPSGDTSPPGFLDVRVQLKVPTDSNLRGELDITTMNGNVSNLQSDIAIHIVGVAGDSESGISNVSVTSEFTYSCASAQGSEVTGIVQTISLPFTALPSPPATPNQTFAFETTTVPNPVEATGCAVGSEGRGPIGMSGFVFITATNGAGLTTNTGRFVFDYSDVGSR